MQPPDEYLKVHQKRFDLSLKWLEPYIKGARVLELGGSSQFQYMAARAGAAVTFATVGDLRKPIDDLNYWVGENWDVVLCMEVIEHIADTDGLHTEWQGDGVAMMLSEAYRMLKPGGILFLTTPNAASITAICHALRLAPPMLYRPHVREYAPSELDEIVRAAGFEIIHRETYDVWLNSISPGQHQYISDFIYRAGYPMELRGEDIFLLARRPILGMTNEAPKQG